MIDKFGNTLSVGDEVVYIQKSLKGSSLEKSSIKKIYPDDGLEKRNTILLSNDKCDIAEEVCLINKAIKLCKDCIFRAKDGYCGYYERKIEAEHKACENYDRKEIEINKDN